MPNAKVITAYIILDIPDKNPPCRGFAFMLQFMFYGQNKTSVKKIVLRYCWITNNLVINQDLNQRSYIIYLFHNFIKRFFFTAP